ncbi:MAG: hypothetical protein AB8D52_11875 [Gammaproteobacteria bacterium]
MKSASKQVEEVSNQNRRKPMEYAPIRLISGKFTQNFKASGSMAEKNTPVAMPAII